MCKRSCYLFGDFIMIYCMVFYYLYFLDLIFKIICESNNSYNSNQLLVMSSHKKLKINRLYTQPQPQTQYPQYPYQQFQQSLNILNNPWLSQFIRYVKQLNLRQIPHLQYQKLFQNLNKSRNQTQFFQILINSIIQSKNKQQNNYHYINKHLQSSIKQLKTKIIDYQQNIRMLTLSYEQAKLIYQQMIEQKDKQIQSLKQSNKKLQIKVDKVVNMSIKGDGIFRNCKQIGIQIKQPIVQKQYIKSLPKLSKKWTQDAQLSQLLQYLQVTNQQKINYNTQQQNNSSHSKSPYFQQY